MGAIVITKTQLKSQNNLQKGIKSGIKISDKYSVVSEVKPILDIAFIETWTLWVVGEFHDVVAKLS